MTRGPGPVFLARDRYRQRRLRDALRMLPVLGALSWLVPLMWARGPDGFGNGAALIYVFAVWTGLIVLGAVLSRRVMPGDGDGPEGAGDGR